MTLYLDTSSLVKRYVDEVGTGDVHDDIKAATLVVSSAIAYAETRATLARLRREKRLTPAGLAAVRRQFEADWATFLVMDVNDDLVRSAGDLADAHGLRGSDSIHLASFARVLAASGEEDVQFSSFDDRLRHAAKTLG